METLTKEEIIFEVLQATGLNWTARKEQVQTKSGLVLPDVYAVTRSDNNSYLGAVGDRYEFLQNHEMIEIAYESGREVFNSELKLNHPWNNAATLGSFGNMGGGSLRDGSRVFVQLELPELYIGRSSVNRFITLTNSHDGSSSLGFGTSNQVVCCQNTFNIANRDLSKFRHTASMQQRIDEAMQSLRRVLQFEDKQMEVFEIAANRTFEKKHIEDIVKSVFGKSLNDSKGDVSTRAKNQMMQLAGDISQSINEQGETLWALFNGVTRYTNHSTNTKDKDFSLMFGTDSAANQRAFETMVGWLNAEELVLA
jgi:phage/plasmid-like protein (TIGR03299 family)